MFELFGAVVIRTWTSVSTWIEQLQYLPFSPSTFDEGVFDDETDSLIEFDEEAGGHGCSSPDAPPSVASHLPHTVTVVH